jgi:2',3'-cyclic-nucleotide 2'-phosphodiesterase (5'-nucleotidase family)
MVNKRKHRPLFIIFLLFISIGINAQDKSIEVVFTSDMHGNVRAVSYQDGSAQASGLARVATWLDDLKRENKEVILLDGGDTIQGNPLMYLAWKRYDYMPNPIIRTMNMMGYDAMTVGNHEFNYGLEYLKKVQGTARFPFLSANILDERTGEPAFPPYKIITRAGLKIGILGLTTPSIPKWELPENYKGLKFEAPEVAAKKYVLVLKEYEKCDLVISVLHAGFAGQDENGEYTLSTWEDSAANVAKINGIDLLLTGHKHRLIEPQRIGVTYAAAAPAYASAVIRVRLDIDSAGNVSQSGEVIPMNEYITEKEEVVEAVKSLHIETENYLNTVLCQTAEDLDAPAERLHDTRLMDILNAAQLNHFKADISAASLLPWSGTYIKAGDVKVSNVFQFYPYENRLVMIKISGAKLKEYLEWSARFYSDARFNSEGQMEVVPSEDISLYNVDFVEGLSYRIDPKAKNGNKVKDILFQGKPLDENAEFKMLVNSYRFMGGGDYKMLKGCEVIQVSKSSIREILIEYLKTNGVSKVQVNNNWQIAPDLSIAGR